MTTGRRPSRPTEGPGDGVPERLGDFRLLDSLGGGGMGLVFRAREESLGREVALKLIRPDRASFPDAHARFRREVEAIARLHHPGIVPVYAYGEEDGTPYFAMERVHGATLADIVEALAGRMPAELTASDLAAALRSALDRRGGGALEVETGECFAGPWPEACARIVREVALALEHAHALGVLHRDVKPSNIFLTVDGRAQLFDFGLSGEDSERADAAPKGLAGSLPYLAPEQVAGRRADRRTDVYGLGATLYELLTLRAPFAEVTRTIDLRESLLHATPASVRKLNPRVGRDLATVCARAMEREPTRRYASAAAFAVDLENALRMRPIDARPSGPATRARRWMQRHPAPTVAAALAFAAFVATPGVFAAVRASDGVRLAAEARRADTNLRGAVEAIGALTERVDHPSLDGLPRIDGVRRQVFESARERLALLPEDAPTANELRARLNLRLGETCLALAEASAAAQAFERSADVSASALQQGRGWMGVAGALHPTSAPRARAALEKAVRLLREAHGGGPQDAATALELARALQRLHVLDGQDGAASGDEARDVAREALEVAEDDAVRAEALRLLADVSLASGRYAAALEASQAAVATRQPGADTADAGGRSWREREWALERVRHAELLLRTGSAVDVDALRAEVVETLRGRYPGHLRLAIVSGLAAERSARAGDDEGRARWLDTGLDDLRAALATGYRGDTEPLAPLRAHPDWPELELR